jgi:hypothetical protein
MVLARFGNMYLLARGCKGSRRKEGNADLQDWFGVNLELEFP